MKSRRSTKKDFDGPICVCSFVYMDGMYNSTQLFLFLFLGGGGGGVVPWMSCWNHQEVPFYLPIEKYIV